MAVGNIKTFKKEEPKPEKLVEKKPEGFDEMIMSKAMAKLYKNKKQFDNSINIRRGL